VSPLPRPPGTLQVSHGVSFRSRSISPINKGTEGPAPSPPSGGNKFWESLPYHVF